MAQDKAQQPISGGPLMTPERMAELDAWLDSQDVVTDEEILEREVADEDRELKLKIAGLVAMVIAGHLVFLAPLLVGIRLPNPAWLSSDLTWNTFVFLIVSLPLFVLAIWVWRHKRLPLKSGGELTGNAARLAAIGFVALQALLMWWALR